ncbi:hypothetical protein [Limobrevibacterium gyesilva]|uniref:Uncharacterized protein n=1 Tax=Limobrevibacterium gyesilva TaxID=2991712 RepID=A0AA41YN98_9PROT|nr:hypothetical protein [Limobrevibacterium gyesilva]MCW3477021.1 hypothetical protein [Limobrevibacterium gyesilva]
MSVDIAAATQRMQAARQSEELNERVRQARADAEQRYREAEDDDDDDDDDDDAAPAEMDQAAQIGSMLSAAPRGVRPGGSAPLAIPMPATASGGMCASVASRCAPESAACRAGGQASCYRAAACLCRANLAAGGCGSDPAGLQRCVAENEDAARRLQSTAPAYTTVPQNRPPPPARAAPPQHPETPTDWCSRQYARGGKAAC